MEILFFNGTIFDGLGNKFNWISFDSKQGIILELGNGNPPNRNFFKKVNLKGKTILPGFQDAHIHIFLTGKGAYNLNLRGVKSVCELKDKLKKYAKEHENDHWIFGFGWDQDLMQDGRYPTKIDLDSVVPSKPVFLARSCWHIAVVNSLALKICNITKQSVDLVGGAIDRDRNGEPTGILRENAALLVENSITFSKEQRKKFFELGLNLCLKLGVTTIQTNDSEAWEIYKELQDEGKVNIRVWLTPMFYEIGKSAPKPGSKLGLLACDRVKIISDGSLGAETAALRKPYIGTNNKGILIHEESELEKIIHDAHSSGYRLEVHAIGDRSAELVLNTFEKVGITPQDRPLLTHCQILGPDLIQKMKKLGVIANIQPQFVGTDSLWVEKRVSPDMFPYAYSWKTLLKEGIHVAGGSDSPIEYPNPLHGLHAAIKRIASNTGTTWRPEECLTFQEALCIYTQEGAYATNSEQFLGTLQRGFKADFVVIDSPDLDKNIDALLAAHVSEVWVEGKERLCLLNNKQLEVQFTQGENRECKHCSSYQGNITSKKLSDNFAYFGRDTCEATLRKNIKGFSFSFQSKL